ncbi:MAG: winged helix-turn-helix transcriptional regulator [Burkholderiales bacterium]|jgi:DNA-binding MarR family transcriptional regulator|nr:winged helix-turn-helix transcriptional regulator [Burkholderiales bacterium]
MTRSTPGRKAPAQAAQSIDSRLVLRQFRQIFNAVKTHFRQVESKAGLGGAQIWALALVREQPGIGVTELARRMDVHPSTASNLVKVLIEKGLVATEKDDVDRRAVQLRVLPAGTRVLRNAPGPMEGVLPDALESLDPALLLRLHRDLSVLIERLRIDSDGAQTPLAEL